MNFVLGLVDSVSVTEMQRVDFLEASQIVEVDLSLGGTMHVAETLNL